MTESDGEQIRTQAPTEKRYSGPFFCDGVIKDHPQISFSKDGSQRVYFNILFDIGNGRSARYRVDCDNIEYQDFVLDNARPGKEVMFIGEFIKRKTVYATRYDIRSRSEFIIS